MLFKKVIKNFIFALHVTEKETVFIEAANRVAIRSVLNTKVIFFP